MITEENTHFTYNISRFFFIVVLNCSSWICVSGSSALSSAASVCMGLTLMAGIVSSQT